MYETSIEGRGARQGSRVGGVRRRVEEMATRRVDTSGVDQ